MPSKFSKLRSLGMDRHGGSRGRLLQWRGKRKQRGIGKNRSASSASTISEVNVDFVRQKAHEEGESRKTKPSGTDAGISSFDSLGSDTIEPGYGYDPSTGSSYISTTTTDDSSHDDDFGQTHSMRHEKERKGDSRLFSDLSYSDSDAEDNGEEGDEFKGDRRDDRSDFSGIVDSVSGIRRALLQTETFEKLISGNACLGGEIDDELMANSLVEGKEDRCSIKESSAEGVASHRQAPKKAFEEGLLYRLGKKLTGQQEALTRRGRSPTMKQGHNSSADGAPRSPRSDSKEVPPEGARCLGLPNAGGCGLGWAIAIADSDGDNENGGAAGLASILKKEKPPAKDEESVAASLATTVLSHDEAAWKAMTAQEQPPPPPPPRPSTSRLNRGTRASILTNALDEEEKECIEPAHFLGDVRCSSNHKRNDLQPALSPSGEKDKVALPRPQREAGDTEGYFKELLSSGIQLQLHDPPTRSPRKKRPGRLFLRFGTRSTTAETSGLAPPHLLWTDGQGRSRALELLGIQSIRKPTPSEAEDFPFAVPSRSLLLSSDGGPGPMLLEAADESQLTAVASALRRIVPLLARKIVLGEGDWVARVMRTTSAGAREGRVAPIELEGVMADAADRLVERTSNPAAPRAAPCVDEAETTNQYYWHMDL